MKKFSGLLLLAVLSGVITLGAYKMLFEKEIYVVDQKQNQPTFVATSFNTNPVAAEESVDFTLAAEKTVHAVVHVKNLTISKGPTSIYDFFYGGSGNGKAQIGSGSGVIISPDGYIVTNNHVIANATELQITLNNNRTYEASLVGTDPETDIALLKIDTDDNLPYLVFGDSDNTKLGEWVLAVGNPFNLTSTVTAGIISAKARDLNSRDQNFQSFIQTDAAVNPGNSGGALVNTAGQLIGINTAITSQTGSYVGYSFAVPSNIAKKVVEDIMEYGSVQAGVLGIKGSELNSYNAGELGINETEGFYIDSVMEDSGAEEAGLISGDIIKKLDHIKISKFSDLSGYLKSKRPNDVINVTILRNGSEKVLPVTIYRNQSYKIDLLGLSVQNLSDKDRKKFKNYSGGVKIVESASYDLVGKLIIEINDEKVENVDQVKLAMQEAKRYDRLSIVLINENGERERLIFQ
ncbi:trypsin-like peptidase domain-containing protein [Abyssalbus ytuae]|uniref:Trypsin-like peptidase domain-containing protein n=1 Tax=Abyssalbus ytuae TaxID=2926907 RepID=A0A9E7D308_9FLAO|nr:trypsin-like peptidase domain-containing protein [Abyssalbus ytuae]UOB17289.1 trypsin-like peptidase domain-containing protein [Abyssalbus ytuae]